MNKSCPWLRTCSCLLAACFLGSFPASAARAADDAPVDAARQELYLSASLNGREADGLLPFLQRRDGLWATAATLRQLGLRLDPGTPADIRIEALPGVAVAFDPAAQRVRITAPVAMLDRSVTLLQSGDTTGSSGRPGGVAGVVASYDLYGETSGRHRSFAAWSELRTTGLGPGVLSQTSLLRSDNSPVVGPPFVRLDTNWRADDADALRTLELGDTVTSGHAWMRRARIGGVAWRRNFALRPQLSTAPFPALAGEATLPSTVELFIDGVRQSVHRVGAGPFRIDTAPRLSGAGTAEIQVRDILGQARTTVIDFYGAPQLLRSGLTDWSVEAGFARRDYGIASARYARDPLLNATARHGVHDGLTIEGMAQAGRDFAAAGAGAALLVGRTGGVLTGSLAASRHAGGRGHQAGMGYNWQGRDFSLSASTLVRSGNHMEAADLDAPSNFSRQDALFLGGRLSSAQVGFGYARIHGGGEGSASWSANASIQLARATTLSVALQREIGTGVFGASLQLLIALDDRRMATLSARHRAGRSELAADAVQAAREDRGGWGWRLRAAAADGTAGGEAHLTRLTGAGQWTAGLAAGDGAPLALRASASGSLLLLESGVHAMRAAPDAFALVQTDGVAGVPVRLENRLVGRTDASGRLLVPDLLSHQRNRIAIDTADLPLDLRPDLTELSVAPASRTGARVSFRIRKVRPLHAIAADWRGIPLPVGTTGQLRAANRTGDASPVVVGHDGEIYIDDLARDSVLSFALDGVPCELALAAGRTFDATELPVLACRRPDPKE